MIMRILIIIIMIVIFAHNNNHRHPIWRRGISNTFSTPPGDFSDAAHLIFWHPPTHGIQDWHCNTKNSVQDKRRMKRTSASFQGHFDVFLILNEKYMLCCCVQWSSQKALTAWCWWNLMVQYSLVIWKRLSLHIVRDWRFPPTWYCHHPERLYTHVWCFIFSLYPHSGWSPSFASTRICLEYIPQLWLWSAYTLKENESYFCKKNV